MRWTVFAALALLAAVVPVCAQSAGCESPGPAQPAAAAQNPAATNLSRWLTAVAQHTPGCAERAAVEIADWRPVDLRTLLEDLTFLSAYLAKGAELQRKDPVRFQQKMADAAANRETKYKPHDGTPELDKFDAIVHLHGQALTFASIQQSFHGNETLIRGAVLHADIAALLRPGSGTQRVVVSDGRESGNASGSLHWEFGRKLLDLITPSPSSNDAAQIWYRATSAYMLAEGLLADAPAHLKKARELFPDALAFLLDEGYFHEKLASPGVQAAMDDVRNTLRPDPTFFTGRTFDVLIGSRTAELQRAEQAFRSAVEGEPTNETAHLRLGHVLAELGQHEAARTELLRLSASTDKDRRYLAELFLGREEAALGHSAEARAHFVIARNLCPAAQSAPLALSQMERQAGRKTAALTALKPITSRNTSSEADDPWWLYYEPHLADAPALMDQMRKVATQ